MARKASSKPADSTANLGFEAKLWLAADKLRNNMDAAEPERSGDSQPQAARRASEARQYKHVVLGLTAASEGEKIHRSVDLLRRVYDWSGASKTDAGSPKGERGGAHQYFLTRNVQHLNLRADYRFKTTPPAICSIPVQ